jgi:cathepsin D
MSGSSIPGILDTGTTLIAMPVSDYITLSQKWMSANSGVSCDGGLCLISGSCSQYYNDFDDLYFRFGDSWYFSVPASSYLIDSNQITTTSGLCVFGV